MKKHVLKHHSNLIPGRDAATEPFVRFLLKTIRTFCLSLVILQVFSQETFRKALLEWIAVSDQPFSEVNHPFFIAMIKTLNPAAKVVCDKTIRSDLMATYRKMHEELKTVIAEIPGKISLTMDGWSSKNVLFFCVLVYSIKFYSFYKCISLK